MTELPLDPHNVVLRYLLLRADLHVIVLALVFTTALRRAIWEPLRWPTEPFLLVPMALAAILDMLLDLGLPKPTAVVVDEAVNAAATAFTAYYLLGKKKELGAFLIRLLDVKKLVLIALCGVLVAAPLHAQRARTPAGLPSTIPPEVLQEGAAAAEMTEEEYLHWLLDYYRTRAEVSAAQAVEEAHRAQQQLEVLQQEAQRLLQEQQRH